MGCKTLRIMCTERLHAIRCHIVSAEGGMWHVRYIHTHTAGTHGLRVKGLPKRTGGGYSRK